MENELILKAYIPSSQEYNFYSKEFKAFMAAMLSKKAKKNDAYMSDTYNSGYYFLRTCVPEFADKVYIGNYNCSKNYASTHMKAAGLRVAFQLVYNPKSKIVKHCKIKSKKSLVFINSKPKPETKQIKSKAPIVKFGGKECIWLNKKECESGKDKTMKLWTLELIDCAVPFSKNGKHNDFGQATELIEQCESELLKKCKQKELDMLVKVKMSKEDNYNKVEPIFEKEKEKNIEKENKPTENSKETNVKETNIKEETQVGEKPKTNNTVETVKTSEEPKEKDVEEVVQPIKKAKEKIKVTKTTKNEFSDETEDENLIYKRIRDAFNGLLNGEINEDKLKQSLKMIVEESRKKPGASEETAKALEQQISQEAEKFNEKLAQKAKIVSAYDSVDKSIDDLKLGGK